MNDYRPAKLRERRSLALVPSTRVAGYSFVQHPVSEAVKEILQQPEVLQGTFIPQAKMGAKLASPGLLSEAFPECFAISIPAEVASFRQENVGDSDRVDSIKVFAALWRVETRRTLDVIRHTPDLCWTLSGWVPVNIGQPRMVILAWNDIRLPFECRVFCSLDKRHQELALWCIFVDGNVLPDSRRFVAADIPNAPQATPTSNDFVVRQQDLKRFLSVLSGELGVYGEKQMIRCSITLRNDEWERPLEALKQFAVRWLALEERCQQ